MHTVGLHWTTAYFGTLHSPFGRRTEVGTRGRHKPLRKLSYQMITLELELGCFSVHRCSSAPYGKETLRGPMRYAAWKAKQMDFSHHRDNHACKPVCM